MRPFALFDLDGTLIRPGSTLQLMHMDSMAAAIAMVTGGTEQFVYRLGELFYGGINLAGFTDAGTIRAGLIHGGVPADEAAELLPLVVREMSYRLECTVADGGWRGGQDVMPGARQLLEALRDAGFALGMSTGNARTVAVWKMRRAGLHDVLRSGGFGDTAVDRDDVVLAGVAAVSSSGNAINGVLIGDTAKDVTAARRAGLRCLAVSSGGTLAADLHAAGADAVLPEIADERAVPILRRLAGLQLLKTT